MVGKNIKAKVIPSTKSLIKPRRVQYAVSLPLIVILLFFSSFTSFAQESDSLAFGESKATTLKFLKSMATIEQEKCDKALFFEKFNIDLTENKEASVIEKIRIKKEPSQSAEDCTTEIPAGSIVKLYNYYEKDKFWAVKFNNKWGFIPDGAVKLFE
ncbi:MAG: hypothetical protein K9G76_10795 [Bacteroidales bacterium]|nr:hypothetical protein [Bacteroidales bacterium]MCF8404257.1 hypothetical protein [Bacteroidales bacterium]